MGRKVLHQTRYFPVGKSYNQHRIIFNLSSVIWLLFCELLPHELARYWQSFLLQHWVVGFLSLGYPSDFQGNLGTYRTIKWRGNYFPLFTSSSALLQRDSKGESSEDFSLTPTMLGFDAVHSCHCAQISTEVNPNHVIMVNFYPLLVGDCMTRRSLKQKQK